MNTVDKLKEMYRIQETFNTTIHPQWREQNFNFSDAVWVECAELMDHLGYKWWKPQPEDWYQAARMELVDILKFLISMDLQNAESFDDCIEFECLGYMFGKIEKTGEYRDSFYSCFYTRVLSLSVINGHLEHAFAAFVDLMRSLDITFDELYLFFIAKDVLNLFRQAHGYSEGKYIKQWGSLEDNDVLNRIIERAIDDKTYLTGDEIYRKLESHYSELEPKV